MNRKLTRGLASVVAVAALVALLGTGQALATLAPPDERVLERHLGRGELGAAEQPSQGSPAASRPRSIRPEPKMGPPPQVDGDEQVASAPVPDEQPDGGRVGVIVAMAVATLLLAVGAATAWRARHRRPQPESTA
jgi:hypothetical protein